MRTRTISLLSTLALVAAACGGGPADAPEVADAAKLSYTLEPGAGFQYEATLDQHIDLTATGDTSVMGDEAIPVDMSADISGVATLTHTVAEGTEPGTFEVTISGEFSDLAVDGTMDGEPIDPDELPDLGVTDPINVTVVVDEQGNVVESGSESVGDLFMAGLSELDALAGAVVDPARLVGPPLPDHEVAVGDTWSKTIDVPSPMNDQEITTEFVSEVTGTDAVDGADVLVIETESTTSKVEVDLSDFLIGMFKSMAEIDGEEVDANALKAVEASLRFAFTLDESTADMTTWFDPAAGRARKAVRRGDARVLLDIAVPDDPPDGMIELSMEMNVDQLIEFRLLGDVEG